MGGAPYRQEEMPESRQILAYQSSSKNEDGKPELEMWRISDTALLRIAYADGTQFWMDRDARELWAAWPENLTLEDAASYLLGPILGVLLRFRGATCLHASAVAFGDRAVAFVGPPGSGKSTTAAALAQRGHAVLSDDIVALVERDNAFFAVPAYPHLSLWPESVGMLYGDSNALPRFTPAWDKRRLALGGDCKFEERELPVAAIYLLGDRRPDSGPGIASVDLRAALLELLPNTYATNILDAQMRAREFEILGRLVARVPVRKLSPSDDSTHLESLCEQVLADFQSLRGRAAHRGGEKPRGKPL